LDCHSGGRKNPPQLSGILGKEIGGSAFARYSDALRNLEGVWNEDNLRAFLMNPQSFAPGSSMPDPQISSTTVANEIIKALQVTGNEQ